MSAIDTLFHQLRVSGRKAIMPFITAGDPNLTFTAEVLRRLAGTGCAMLELGIPYSDPIADGPVIQASYTRALGHKIKLAEILKMLAEHRMSTPLVTMVTYAIVFRHGLEQYVTEAKAAGVAGMIVPDLPFEEAEALAKICRREDFSLIQLVAPTTPRERAVRIAEHSSGFLYYMSVAGITGERSTLPPKLVENVAWLRQHTPLPICIGFGISKPEHIRTLAPVADGLIVGSAIVRRMADAPSKTATVVLNEISEYVASLVNALADAR
jgi:tryptophan synthase alpha chain